MTVTVAPLGGGRDHRCDWRRWDRVRYAVVRCPSIVNDAHSPEAMVCVAPPSEDDQAVQCDFAAGGIEENLAAGVAKDSDRKQIVGEAREAVRHFGVGG